MSVTPCSTIWLTGIEEYSPPVSITPSQRLCIILKTFDLNTDILSSNIFLLESTWF